ncbi:hypothetical protein AMS59_12600 [Lysinibacillus sp. FJAT-14745]|uniref:hypothetical protein n=1 Tax=Lysinibacillus sp. FJAT-14745 TaxID=1704289 RepID=UPI0006ABEC19|nr:hypothetical protein [Lysinibacillus sp. FJAT-14745]KOP78654.1 hypothetical protein AMS59_12600 [Lysinibacillus sp. FJAT-14745]
MYLDTVMRLSALGVTLSSAPSSSDDMLLKFAIDKVTNHINNQTNLYTVPQGLHEIAVDMVVGEFLLTKKSMGLLDVETLNFEVVAKQVQDGDTNVVFAVEANNTPEAQFNAFVVYLQHNEVDFVRYRVLTW